MPTDRDEITFYDEHDNEWELSAELYEDGEICQEVCDTGYIYSHCVKYPSWWKIKLYDPYLGIEHEISEEYDGVLKEYVVEGLNGLNEQWYEEAIDTC